MRAHPLYPLRLQTSPPSQGQISPDGKWLAYFSSEFAPGHVFLMPVGDQPVIGGGRRHWQVSTIRVTEPRWRGDGKELFVWS